MAKGKFKKQMHEKGMDIQRLRNEMNIKPTSNGYALADSINNNSNYIDSFIDDLMDESSQMNKRGRAAVNVNKASALARTHLTHGETEYVFYINHPEMTEYSDRFNTILRDKTLYFVPDLKGKKIDLCGVFPKIRAYEVRKELSELVEIDKNYPIHKIVSRDNRKIWFIEL